MNTRQIITKIEPNILRAGLYDRFGAVVIELEENAAEMVVFGSRACGVQKSNSDWDVFIVGEKQKMLVRKLQLVWRTLESVHMKEWLGSELANHIAAYGVWLTPQLGWQKDVYFSSKAIDRKVAKILSSIDKIKNYRSDISDLYFQDRLIRLRRDIQRLVCLRTSTATPPSVILDEDWCFLDASAKKTFCHNALIEVGVTLNNKALVDQAALATFDDIREN